MSRFSGSQGKGAVRALRKIKRTEAEARNALTSPERRRSFGMTVFIVTTSLGDRRWCADDEDHARWQHYDAFPDDPDELILSVVREVA